MAWQKGQSGNPKEKTLDQFYSDLLESWRKHSVEALERVKEKDYAEYVELVTAVLDKVIFPPDDPRRQITEYTTEEVAEIMDQGLAKRVQKKESDSTH